MSHAQSRLPRLFCLHAIALLAAAAQSRAQSLIYSFEGDPAIHNEFGHLVAPAGDVDGDGLVDLLVAARGQSPNYENSVFVVSGGSGGLLHEIVNPNGLPTPVTAMTALGDLDGDGHDDFAVASTTAFPTPDVHVYSGLTGSPLYVLQPPLQGTRFGQSMADVGDVDLDGFDDLLVGAPGNASNPGTNMGNAYVFSGVDGTLLLWVKGSGSGDRLGWSVAGAGDVDGDGHPDLVIGVPYADDPAPDAGAVEVRSGLDGGLLWEFKGALASSFLGTAVCGPGDLDGDLVPDVVIYASPKHGEARSGATGALLYAFGGPSTLIRSLAPLPDADGDGVDDFVASAIVTPGTAEAQARSGVDGSLLFGLTGPTILEIAGLSDLDGDGLGDVLIGDPKFFQLIEGRVSVYSSGSFQPPGTATCFGDGSQVPCPCGSQSVYEEGFDAGTLPAGWAATGLWHVTTSCPGLCGGDPFLYFGIDSQCTYETFAPILDSVFSAPIDVSGPAQGHELLLDLCWSLDAEKDGESWILEVHGSAGTSKIFAFDLPTPPKPPLDLTAFVGQVIQLEFRVYTDGLWDFYGGWKIDDLRLYWSTNNAAHPEGCLNSTGRGGLLGALGSSSVSADDLRLFASQLPAQLPSIVVVGSQLQATPFPFGGGLICFAGQTHRYLFQPTSALGTFTLEDPVTKSGGLLVPGSTFHFQAWFRDDPSKALCGVSSNLSNAYSVTFTP